MEGDTDDDGVGAVDDGLVDKRNLRQRDEAILGRLANPEVVECHRQNGKKKVPVLQPLLQGTTKVL